MATSDFSCSLGPVLSLSNQNKTFVKIPSGSTYSTHYDELTLTLKRDRERTTARERFLQAICLYSKEKNKIKWAKDGHLNGITICPLIWTDDKEKEDNLVPASTFCLLLSHSLPPTVCGWKEEEFVENATRLAGGWLDDAKMDWIQGCFAGSRLSSRHFVNEI